MEPVTLETQRLVDDEFFVAFSRATRDLRLEKSFFVCVTKGLRTSEARSQFTREKESKIGLNLTFDAQFYVVWDGVWHFWIERASGSFSPAFFVLSTLWRRTTGFAGLKALTDDFHYFSRHHYEKLPWSLVPMHPVSTDDPTAAPIDPGMPQRTFTEKDFEGMKHRTTRRDWLPRFEPKSVNLRGSKAMNQNVKWELLAPFTINSRALLILIINTDIALTASSVAFEATTFLFAQRFRALRADKREKCDQWGIFLARNWLRDLNSKTRAW